MTKDAASYDLPRPALGRRPWFALLRRARKRRRFALAMVRERTRATGRHQPEIRLRGPGWTSPPLRVARGVRLRWRGLRRDGGSSGLILATRSIHGIGLGVALRYIALRGDGVVMSVGTLEPGTIVAHTGAAWWVELRADDVLPPVGCVLAADRLAPCPDG